MNSKNAITGSRTSLLVALALTSALASPAYLRASGGGPIRLGGQNDITKDRQALQDALDRARPGGIIELSGRFQLDGERVFITRSPLTLRGVVLDNDGDGRSNEDWADGADNDGDGRVDEDDWDATLVGLTNPDGTPVKDPDRNTPFNRGLVLQGITGTAERVVIRGLKFQGHNRAITFQPEVAAVTNRCEHTTITNGRLVKSEIRDNFFTRNERAIQVIGAVEDLDIKRNLFVANPAVDLLAFGELLSCAENLNQPGVLPVGVPRGTRISLNEILTSNISLFTDRTEDLSFKDNLIDKAVLAVFVRADRGLEVKGNEIRRAMRGVTTAQLASGARIVENIFIDSTTYAILLQNASSGYFIKGNGFQGSKTADIQLDATTTGNTVIARPTDSLIDLGTDNQVIVRGDGNED
jgi:nitrous oxidase accessory protein NosD